MRKVLILVGIYCNVIEGIILYFLHQDEQIHRSYAPNAPPN
jgi:hypothetical protein